MLEMTLDEAIEHCKENVQKETQNGNLQCAIQHNQLAIWLSQLEESKSKAAAYDRLMSMNSVSKNDIEIVLDGDDLANAKRIVACVNACEGINDAVIEAGIIKKALVAYLGSYDKNMTWNGMKVWEDV